jgi:4-carboxymuconolactone decarboxylase
MEQARRATQTTERDRQILSKPPRIDPIENWTDEMRKLVKFLPGYENSKPVTYGIFLNHMDFFAEYQDLMSFFLLRGSLPPRDRELATLRVGWRRQVPFIWGEHVRIGKEIGLNSIEIERVSVGPDALEWNEHERALLTAVDELIDDSFVTDQTWNTLTKSYDAKRLIELVALVGQYQLLGNLQNSLRIPLFEANPGLTAR